MAGEPEQQSEAGMLAPVTQGYMTMAYGARRYFEMAANLAMSIRLNDNARPITLLYRDRAELPDDLATHFDLCASIEDAAGYKGNTLKLGVYEPTPYDEAFYLDADCLLMKPDMERHWARYGEQDFSVAGEERVAGIVDGLHVERICAAASINHALDANWGAFFFRKGDGARAVFEQARSYYRAAHPDMIAARARDADGRSDQPYLSAATVKCGFEPISYKPSEGTFMATTYRARAVNFDISRERASLQKPTGFRILGRLWAKGWVRHETTLGHFVNMQPRKVYQAQSDWLRTRFDAPRYQF